MSKREMSAFYVRLGATIRYRRESCGISQERLAKAIGFTRTSICNIEAGRQKPLINTLIDIARALSCTAVDFMRCSETVELR